MLLTVVALVLVAAAGGWLWFRSRVPQYEGELALPGLKQPVEVWHDAYGVPHIYAQNDDDAHFALGYLHAQERLFQMEIIRRVSTGRLAELVGHDGVKIDRFFRTLGVTQKAKANAEKVFSGPETPWTQAAKAYLKGINYFLHNGPTPVEFTILGIPKEDFIPENIYHTAAFMSVGFAEGMRLDPILDEIARTQGDSILSEWVTGWNPADRMIPVWKDGQTAPKTAVVGSHASATGHAPVQWAREISALIHAMPATPFHGSNSWVLSPAKSKSGKVIFCNDAHIGYAQPNTWWEAHLETPTTSVYGNFLAGVPFPVIAHTRHHAWGMTMLENDDVTYYRETLDQQQPGKVKYQGQWANIETREETIHVKGGQDTVMQVQITPHGPIINSVTMPFDTAARQPVALWWTYLHIDSDLLEPLWKICHATTLSEARNGASLVTAPGINLMYGDADGNVAWWACAKLPKMPAAVSAVRVLDGASGKDDPQGWYDFFTENPSSENPPQGYVYSANNQPEAVKGVLYPGYYAPESRSRRITDLLEGQPTFSAQELRQVITDDNGFPYPKIAAAMAEAVKGEKLSGNQQAMLNALSKWNGNHDGKSIEPTIFYHLMWQVLRASLEDQIGDEMTEELASNFLILRSLPVWINNANSRWWDDIRTPAREGRREVILKALAEAEKALTQAGGKQMQNWRWSTFHTLELGHPIGQKKPFNLIFNVGPTAVPGGKEVINNTGFSLKPDENGHFPALYGPSKRIIIDFADVEAAVSVLPSGQSGHVLSPHYDDQFGLYTSNQFRPMLMNRTQIEKSGKKLIMKPM